MSFNRIAENYYLLRTLVDHLPLKTAFTLGCCNHLLLTKVRSIFGDESYQQVRLDRLVDFDEYWSELDTIRPVDGDSRDIMQKFGESIQRLMIHVAFEKLSRDASELLDKWDDVEEPSLGSFPSGKYLHRFYGVRLHLHIPRVFDSPSLPLRGYAEKDGNVDDECDWRIKYVLGDENEAPDYDWEPTDCESTEIPSLKSFPTISIPDKWQFELDFTCDEHFDDDGEYICLESATSPGSPDLKYQCDQCNEYHYLP